MRHAKQKKTDRIKRNNTLLFVTKLLLASKYKSHLLYLLILFIISVFTFSVDDQEAITLYINKLQEFSDHKISEDQKLWVQNFYLNNKNRDPLQEERHKIRKEFNSKKHKLKQEWEAHYKLKWPKEVKAQVLLEKSKQEQNQLHKTEKKDKNKARDNGSVTSHAIESYSNNYQAHHAIPINAGGVNTCWNITPLSSKNHKLLHESFEEKACFSHEFIHREFMRFILKIQMIFLDYFGHYINKRGTNYAH